jgi:hypothetical protein
MCLLLIERTGDGWLYGIPSDPLKQAMLKEVSRQRVACVQSGECDPTSPGMAAFDRLLVRALPVLFAVPLPWSRYLS